MWLSLLVELRAVRRRRSEKGEETRWSQGRRCTVGDPLGLFLLYADRITVAIDPNCVVMDQS